MPPIVVDTPTITNTTMTNANTEYSFTIPAGTVRFSIKCQDGTAFRLAFATGKVATPTAPYLTILANGAYNDPGDIQIGSSDLTVYVGCGSAGKVIECVTWPKR